MKPASRNSRPTPPRPTSGEHEIVSFSWLAKAIGISVLSAAVCAWIALGLLFYQGQWQMVLHPTRSSTTPSGIGSNPLQIIHFAPDDSGVPQLAGWWIPAAAGARYPHITLLYLRDGSGNLLQDVPQLTVLQQLGVNILAFDYRGFGQSATVHPTHQRMFDDSLAALRYLTAERRIPDQHLVLYGSGLGASLATSLALSHPAIPVLILDHPQGDLLALALKDPRTHLIPARLLFHERFPLTRPLTQLHTPKLLISRSSADQPPPDLRSAADPKTTVEFSATPSSDLYLKTLRRFLDQYLPPTPIPATPLERRTTP